MKKTYAILLFSVVSFSASAAGNISKGKVLAEKYNCATCHGKDYGTPIDPSYPKLAGQHRDYLEHALTAYKRGDAPNGRNNAIMTGQVKPLTNQDIKDLAAYFHSLPTTLVTHR
ncbi:MULTISPECIES: cytochrome c [unclassified Janthinobacterium]|uniref:c-type cytochrome n=1 Tax=unclassified Janthinobacterium TaxID=2610881 RepID=UPI00161206F3|nr:MULTISPECIES: cytochrome c [unclassified Janthinobacterium]MBB5367957.1 cytochrome c553 [Janthinobacterium sp. K2C7]MBB5379565.1 cytochrome c553 [Janthinobacterium sp. K2Li3]MBB5386339.1 cytochrome c553 [Janthinobacterium sp. K2E3]